MYTNDRGLEVEHTRFIIVRTAQKLDVGRHEAVRISALDVEVEELWVVYGQCGVVLDHKFLLSIYTA